MIVRALSATGDWTYGQSLSNYKKNNAAVQQNIQTRLSSFLNDCFFDTQAGIDWFNLLGGKDQISLNLAVTAVILNTQFVSNPLQISITLNTDRQLTISYSVNTSFGVVTGAVTAITQYLTTENFDILTTESGSRIIV